MKRDRRAFHYHQRMCSTSLPGQRIIDRTEILELRAKQALALVALLGAGLPMLHAQVVAAPSAPTVQSSSHPRTASMDEYREHLNALNMLVQACAKARDMKGCDPAQVGPDDEVPIAAGANSPRRLVRYGWLRVLISQARDKDAPLPKAVPATKQDAQAWQDVRPAPRSTTQLLEDAQTRLVDEGRQAVGTPSPPVEHKSQRDAMKQVLSGREYSDLEEPSAQDSAFEQVGNWLNKLLERAMRASAAAPWLGRVLVWGFIIAVCVCLAWILLQLQRRWRVRLVPEDRGPAPGAASAIHWQLWLDDARRAAALGQWREAIHFVYWAAISRLESKRLWPADRARTPREYLALVGPEDPRLAGLTTLTGSFERVWYGGRAAGQRDYQRAEQIASALISGTEIPGLSGEGQL